MVWKCALKSSGNEEVDGVGARRWRKRQLTWRVRIKTKTKIMTRLEG